MTQDEKQALFYQFFQGRIPDNVYLAQLFENSMAVHLDPVMAWQNVIRCVDWVANQQASGANGGGVLSYAEPDEDDKDD